MYTHLSVETGVARSLFEAYAPKPLRPGQTGVVTRATLSEHFAEFGQVYLSRFGAILEQDLVRQLFVLKFREYLSRLPEPLLKSAVVRAEIVRYNSAPTKARAGFYENPAAGFSATVERVFPQKSDRYPKPPPLYAQNITVVGPTLARVQEFNGKLSCGFYNRFLIVAFE